MERGRPRIRPRMLTLERIAVYLCIRATIRGWSLHAAKVNALPARSSGRLQSAGRAPKGVLRERFAGCAEGGR